MLLDLTDQRLAVCRLPADAKLPTWADLTPSRDPATHSDAPATPIISITRTTDELSIIADERLVPDDVEAARGWRALVVRGPLDFALTGVLASLAAPLAEADVPIFVLSTYDTDWLLIPDKHLATAIDTLRAAGHEVHPQP